MNVHNAVPDVEAGDGTHVAGWPRPDWATRTVLDDLRLDHQRSGELVRVGDHSLRAVLAVSDVFGVDGGAVSVNRHDARIDITDSGVGMNALGGVLIGGMTVGEARQFALSLLELVQLAEQE